MKLCFHYILMGPEVCILFPFSEIKGADLRWLSFTTDLVYVLNLQTVTYFEQSDASCYHNTQFCMTHLHGKTLGARIIVAHTVHVPKTVLY